jgi:uncharacterized protein (TIGR02145 family)
MKKLFFTIVLTSALFSCKKESSTPSTNNTNNNGSTDTTKSSSNSPIVNSIDCSSMQLTGTLKKGEIANTVSVKINYTGGNGKAYDPQTISSTGVLGLTANLIARTLTTGNGVLSYNISGTPSTAGNASFEISLGGKNCLINVNVEDVKINPTSGYGPSIKDVEGNSYKTVYIGTQQWMAENLNVSKYNDGTTIPNITENAQWSELTTGAWASDFNNDPANNNKSVKFYNWYTVSSATNGNKNICPIAWHVPTDSEWVILIDYLGGGTVAGGKMKEAGTINWVKPNTDATNTSLFSGLPYGELGSGYGDKCWWWSSTEVNFGVAKNRYLVYNSGNIGLDSNSKKAGFSIRCIKD